MAAMAFPAAALPVQDAKIVDSACLALTRIAEAFSRSPAHLETLCGLGLVSSIVQMVGVSESGSMTSQLQVPSRGEGWAGLMVRGHAAATVVRWICAHTLPLQPYPGSRSAHHLLCGWLLSAGVHLLRAPEDPLHHGGWLARGGRGAAPGA